MDAIQQAGFANVELVATQDVFEGAEGEANAHAFGTMGANIRAGKP